ncbi:MAG: hypothetical protein ACTSRG_07105 [Candidatus Helarchaeota archaeon]
MIQNILIIKKTGLCIYEKRFGSISFDQDIVSGFFSAFFSFTKKLWNAYFQDIFLGKYHLLFEWLGEELILVAIFDKDDSIISVQLKLLELKKVLQTNFSAVIKLDMLDVSTFKSLDKIIEDIVKKPEIIVTIDQVTKSQKILKEFIAMDEVIDTALLSINGRPLLKPKNREFLEIIIKQIDAYWKFKTEILDQIILYYEKNYILLLKGENRNLENKFILATLFDRNIPVGLSTMLVEDVAAKISRIR